MWRGLGMGLCFSLSLLAACSTKDDEDEPEEREWRCFEGPEFCTCTDVSDGSMVASSEPEVAACSHTNCYAFGNDQRCYCEPMPFTPGAQMPNARPVSACPFE